MRAHDVIKIWFIEMKELNHHHSFFQNLFKYFELKTLFILNNLFMITFRTSILLNQINHKIFFTK